MGYYTNYKLKVTTQIGMEYLGDLLKNISGYYFERHQNTFESSEIKWYSSDIDMKELSLEYPEAIFQLDGEGEETGDIWRIYYKNGKSQSANTKIIIQHDDFDESKLK